MLMYSELSVEKFFLRRKMARCFSCQDCNPTSFVDFRAQVFGHAYIFVYFEKFRPRVFSLRFASLCFDGFGNSGNFSNTAMA